LRAFQKINAVRPWANKPKTDSREIGVGRKIRGFYATFLGMRALCKGLAFSGGSWFGEGKAFKMGAISVRVLPRKIELVSAGGRGNFPFS